MLELSFSAADVARLRFAFSPLWEIVASIRVLKREEEHAIHRPWAARAKAGLKAAGVEFPLLSALVPASPQVIPGFVCPPPRAAAPELSVELAALRAQPPDQVRRTLDELPELSGPHLRELYEDPGTGLSRLAGEMQRYWDAALAPYWPRMLELLEGDVLHRSRRLAEGGVAALFGDLDDSLAWKDETLRAVTGHTPALQSLDGRGLLLSPSVFAWPRTYHIVDRDFLPTLRYPPRGVGTLWERRPLSAPRHLVPVIGRTRALILAELRAPMSGSALADRTGLTTGAISQHLSALRGAGLTRAHRHGRFVLHTRTRLGEALLNEPPQLGESGPAESAGGSDGDP
ncbi:DNA-binding transcriptional ArsR family regulator [Nocardiopsis mwathae]|uniref:DNA-binding transcriptional ArsR family regulator n=1 Tax=Nocardiopsis mwathae TaxID=1472723 RepID=A0A7X0D4Z9_9ACTN|nr:ArsR family transcriptional regulator [Nocardiopsis mwathae]MBB6170614.1 DNA-binding transcriptional ArsR family regulator [Nocardiopsis mwathae]